MGSVIRHRRLGFLGFSCPICGYDGVVAPTYECKHIFRGIREPDEEDTSTFETIVLKTIRAISDAGNNKMNSESTKNSIINVMPEVPYFANFEEIHMKRAIVIAPDPNSDEVHLHTI